MKIKGSGSIEKRGKNTWRIRFNLGISPTTGKYTYSPWRTVKGTKADVMNALAEYRTEIEGGIRLDADKVKPPKKIRKPVRCLDKDGTARLVTALADAEEKARAHAFQHRATKPRREHSFEKCVVQASHYMAEIMAVRISLATGTRRGETLGLTWGAVNPDEQYMRIQQQMTVYGISRPKTDRGNRIISLDDVTCQMLAEWKKTQAEYLAHLGIKQTKETPVINNEIGGFCDPNGFDKWWRRFRKEYGFEDIRLHDLRHTQATLLIAQGVDIKTVQNRLGHTLASTTLDIYAGVVPANDRDAANIVGNILNPMGHTD